MPTYLITLAGYCDNSNGPPDYPDEHETFVGTEQELREYLLKEETQGQAEAYLWDTHRPHYLCYRNKSPEPMNDDLWRVLEKDAGRPDTRGQRVRAVCMVEEMADDFLAGLLKEARDLGIQKAKGRVEEARHAVAARKHAAAESQERHERELLAVLKTKYPNG